MAQITGKYHHECNENLDEYFKAVGVPYVPRKIMVTSHPDLIIAIDKDSNEWTKTTNSFFMSVVAKFKLGEEYEEHMPGGIVLKCTTIQDSNKLITSTTSPDGIKTSREYEFTDTHCNLTLKSEAHNIVAKRYFKRVVD